MRMVHGRATKAVLEHNLGGTRRKGRPTVEMEERSRRYEEGRSVQLEANGAGHNRKQWQKVVKQAVGLPGL